MKILRFSRGGAVKHGILETGGRVREITGSIYEPFTLNGNTYNLEEVILLAPCEPSKVVCVGLNYRAHIAEFRKSETGFPDEPVLFLKPSTAVVGPGADIVYPKMSSQVDYEAELAVVVGKKARNLSPDQVPGIVLGYTCANDVTARDLQKKDGQWTRAKSFDTFVPLGPWIETDLEVGSLRIQLYLNNERKQDSDTGNMIFPVPQLVSFVSGVMTLLPGDVILTGTPAGVGPMRVGDTVEVVVEGIGSLVNRMV